MRRWLPMLLLLSLLPAIALAQTTTSTVAQNPLAELAEAMQQIEAIRLAFKNGTARMIMSAILGLWMWFMRNHALLVRDWLAKLDDDLMPVVAAGFAAIPSIYFGLQQEPPIDGWVIARSAFFIWAGALTGHKIFKLVTKRVLPWIARVIPFLAKPIGWLLAFFDRLSKFTLEKRAAASAAANGTTDISPPPAGGVP